jgi:hypothetical protein
MLVHSFHQTHRWFDDFVAFASLLGAKPELGKAAIVPGRQRPGLHLGWVQGDARFLHE